MSSSRCVSAPCSALWTALVTLKNRSEPSITTHVVSTPRSFINGTCVWSSSETPPPYAVLLTFRTLSPWSCRAASRRRSRASCPAASAYSDTRLGWIGTIGSMLRVYVGREGAADGSGTELRELSLPAIRALDGRHRLGTFGDADEVDRGERLRQVLAAPGAPPGPAVLELRLGREQDHGNVAGLFVVRQGPQDRDAVQLGEHDVEHDHVGLLTEGQLEARLAVGRLDDLVPGELEVHPAEHQDVRLVVDHQYPHVVSIRGRLLHGVSAETGGTQYGPTGPSSGQPDRFSACVPGTGGLVDTLWGPSYIGLHWPKAIGQGTAGMSWDEQRMSGTC